MLASGMLLVVMTGRMDQIAWRFLRNVTLVAVTIVFSVSLWRLTVPLSPGDATAFIRNVGGFVAGTFALAAAFLAPLAAQRSTLFRFACLVSALSAGSAGYAWALQDVGDIRSSGFPHGLIIINLLLTAGLLGGVTITWLLGHAYLTATRMTIAPLRHFTHLLSWLLGLRIASVLLFLFLGWLWSGGADISFLRQLHDAWLIVLMRLLLGLVCPSVLVYMVVDCVRLRSTQSATGILYFGSVFLYVGELCALQFLSTYDWPI